MSFGKHVLLWTPGCGRPHPEMELILAWARGTITLIEKQRITEDGKKYGEPLKVQYPCWNPDTWQFGVAKDSQMTLDLGEVLVTTRPKKTGKLSQFPTRSGVDHSVWK